MAKATAMAKILKNCTVYTNENSELEFYPNLQKYRSGVKRPLKSHGLTIALTACIALVVTLSCVNISGVRPGKGDFISVGARLCEQIDQIVDPYRAQSVFGAMSATCLEVRELAGSKAIRSALSYRCLKNSFSFFNTERLCLFAANLMDASLRR
jgi:hypothetical protein